MSKITLLKCLFLCAIIKCSLSLKAEKNVEKTKIGIIGGGIGGASTAHYLRRHFDKSVDITVFNHGHVGGRLSTVEMAGRTYEIGGSVIHPANKLMVDFVESLGLRKRTDEPFLPFSLISSEGNVFHTSSWSWMAKLQMLWRYGTQLLKLPNFISVMLENFAVVYPHLESGKAFSSVPEMLDLMSPKSRKPDINQNLKSMLNDTLHSLQVKLLDLGFSEQFINELVTAAVRTNYGQMPDLVHGFVGSVALAGAEGGLWEVEGGNRLVVEKLLRNAEVELLPERVSRVALLEDGRFTVDHSTSSGSPNSTIFDIVVIACPQTSDKNPLLIDGLPITPKFPGKYHRTVATLVHGEINAAFVGFEDGKDPSPMNFFIDRKLNVNSLSLLFPVDYQPDEQVPRVWKVFSQSPLSKQELGEIFSEVKETEVANWLAYPKYSVPENETLSGFILHDNLYYTSVIEWSASAMEMSSIAGRNVANLIAAKDPPPVMEINRKRFSGEL